MQLIQLEQLVSVIIERGSDHRTITAIAGPPAAGKSTLAASLEVALNRIEPGSSAVLSMDGYHLDDLVLLPRGLRPQKGAPHTFDVAGFRHMLTRLQASNESEIAVPVFDREIEIARAGARMIEKSVRHLIVEGNYLLLDREPWRSLLPMFATTVMAAANRAILRERLVARWVGLGLDPQAVTKKVDENDLVNVNLVLDGSRSAEFLVDSE